LTIKKSSLKNNRQKNSLASVFLTHGKKLLCECKEKSLSRHQVNEVYTESLSSSRVTLDKE
jgi:hypothetical protein